jgi:polyisoprenyl-phosphate glycosyltransferase
MDFDNTLILTPVFDDWASFEHLIKDIDRKLANSHNISILAINDGSIKKFRLKSKCININSIDIINLIANVGHQRAISIGLSSINKEQYSSVVVMDCDGEDKVEDINKLIKLNKETGNAIVAKRKKRSESSFFKIFYFFYKFLFRILTGRKINFGNFSILPSESIEKICSSPELWNNFPATLLKLKLAINFVDVSRGNRYSGSSKMNLISLVKHGLSAISIFMNEVLIRLLLIFSILMVSLLIVVITILSDDLTTISDYLFHTILTSSIMLFIFNSYLLTKLLISLNKRSNIIDPIKISYSKFILNIDSIYKKTN